MARRKKLSPGEIRKRITALHGCLKPKSGDKPFAEEWADHKREEMELADRKFQLLKP